MTESSQVGYSCTPLHPAAWAGRTELVGNLLHLGPTAKEINEDGISGLMYPMKVGYMDIERVVHEAGATLDGTTSLGYLVSLRYCWRLSSHT